MTAPGTRSDDRGVAAAEPASAPASEPVAGGASGPVSAGSAPALGVVAAWLALLAGVMWWGRAIVEGGTNLKLGVPPFHAIVEVRLGPGTLVAIGVAALLVVGLPWVSSRVGFRGLLALGFAASFAWIVALNSMEGTDGLVRGMQSERHEYPADVERVEELGPGVFLDTFTERIDDYTTHVRGHPPGFLLLLWALRGAGDDPVWVAVWVCIVGGALATPAVLAAVRAAVGEGAARAAMPFVVVAPAALWMGSSADGAFAGVGALAVSAAIVAASRGPDAPTVRTDLLALGGGVALGAAMMGSYGLALLGLVPLPVLVARRAWRVAVLWGVGAAAVLLAFLPAGFWWLDGLQTTRREYFDGIASVRPFSYFVVANLVAFSMALGPATLVGLARLRDRALWLVVGGGLAAALAADLSGMSKGEVERIWLPFAVWVLPAAAVLAGPVVAGSWRTGRAWMALQLAVAMVVQTVLITGW